MHANFEYCAGIVISTLQSRKSHQNRKIKNLTPSVDGDKIAIVIKFYRDLLRIGGALGFFQETSPPNNKLISSVWGPENKNTKQLQYMTKKGLQSS